LVFFNDPAADNPIEVEWSRFKRQMLDAAIPRL
jgi:hypothetical protein